MAQMGVWKASYMHKSIQQKVNSNFYMVFLWQW
jgi:hypothetical protein